MALPKIDQPLFEIEIPSTGKKTKYRPFTVKEEKILLIAQESREQNQILLAVKQIITNCVSDIDVEKLAIFDLEYLILNIRAKSVNNEICLWYQGIYHKIFVCILSEEQKSNFSFYDERLLY